MNYGRMVELGRIELPTFSMRTRRATNCAIAPGATSQPRCQTLAGPPPDLRIGWLSKLFAGRPTHSSDRACVVGAIRGDARMLEVIEDRILVVAFENDGAGPP